MRRVNHIAFITLFAVILVLLLNKAVKLPVLTDEAITSIYLDYSVRDIIMYKDHYPNNHILNTLLTKFFIWVFGDHQLVLRLPNMLFFLVYGVGIFRINRLVLKEDSVFFIPAALLFVANPYLLDFFGMCRGYGISCGLAVLAISYLLTAYRNNKSIDAWIALILAILASYANFTLLVFWVTMTLLVAFFFRPVNSFSPRRMGKPALIIGAISVFYLALIATPVIKMQNYNEFQFWTSNGFYAETVYPLILYSIYGSDIIPGPHFIAVVLFLIIGLNLTYIVFQFRHLHHKADVFKQPIFLTTAILLITAFVNILQCILLKTPNLHGRTALFFYPLTISMIISFIGIIPFSKQRIWKILPACILALICLIHLADRFKINWVRDAWYSVDTFEILDYLKHENEDGTVFLKTQGSLYHSFYYYTSRGKAPWVKLDVYQGETDVNTNAGYYFVFPDQQKLLEEKFDKAKVFKSGMVLMKKKSEKV